jgi:hypothetical protein
MSRWRRGTQRRGRANHRVEILEAELEEKTLAAEQPPVAIVSAMPSATVAAVVTPLISTAKLEAAAKTFCADGIQRMAGLPETEKRAALAVMFFENRLTYPGCETDFSAIDTTKNARLVDDARFSGMARIARGVMQGIINPIFKK